MDANEEKLNELDVITEEGQEVTGYEYEEDYSGSYDIPEPISGWLSVFLWLGVCGGLFITLVSNLFVYANSGISSLFDWLDIAYLAVFASAGILTVTAFLKRSTDAVALAKTFVVLTFVSGLITVIVGGDGNPASYMEGLRSGWRPMIWAVIWFTFLCVSAKVERMIPSHTRKMSKRCWAIIVAAAVIFIATAVSIAVTVGNIKSNMESRQERLEATELGPNEFTDGVYVVTMPMGMVCDQSEENDITYFEFTDPANTGSVIISYGGYDVMDQGIFDQCWKDLKMGISTQASVNDRNDYLSVDTPYEMYCQKGTTTGVLGSGMQLWLVMLYDASNRAFCGLQFIAPERESTDQFRQVISSVRFLE